MGERLIVQLAQGSCSSHISIEDTSENMDRSSSTGAEVGVNNRYRNPVAEIKN